MPMRKTTGFCSKDRENDVKGGITTVKYSEDKTFTAEDIEGLIPLEIQDKFALPNTLIYVWDVELEAGTHIGVGEVNPLEGWGLVVEYNMI